MTNQKFLGEFLSLPHEAQSQVLRLIAFLKQKHISAEHTSQLTNTDLIGDSFVGMWRDRQDLASTTWVRSLRGIEY